MFGFSRSLLLVSVLFSTLRLEALPQKHAQRQIPTPFFVSSSLLNWTESGEISNSSESYKLNISNFGLGLGLGYAFSLPVFSLMLQGQLTIGQSNIGFPPGDNPPGFLLDAQNISSLGLRTDFSFLARFAEGVALGIGFPIMKTFFLSGKIGSDFDLKRSQSIAWGAFVNMRLRKNAFVLSPKVGFLGNLKHSFASLDFQFHFY